MIEFHLKSNASGILFISLNQNSCAIFIENRGFSFNETMYPQPDVDYGRNNRLKIIGVDMI